MWVSDGLQVSGVHHPQQRGLHLSLGKYSTVQYNTVQYSTVQYSTVCTWSQHCSVSPDDVMVAIVELLCPVQHRDVLSAQVVGHGQVALRLNIPKSLVLEKVPSECS